MNAPLRVLQVFGRMDRGGAETMVMTVYRNIDRSKIQFDFVVHSDQTGAFDAEITALGGRIFHAPRYTGKNHVAYVRWWDAFYGEHPEYPVIHSHIRSTASLLLKSAKKQGRRTVAHSHSTSNGKGFSAVIKNILQKNIVRQADYLFACSLEAGRWLFGKKAVLQPNFYIFRNAIDTEAFRFDPEKRESARAKLDLSDRFCIGHIGRMVAAKNPFGLISIWKAVCEKRPDSVLLWVGSGPLEGEIRQKVREEGLSDAVVFTGERSDIPDLLCAMDGFLLPSLWEGLPVVLLEAQANGLPVFLSEGVSDEGMITPLVRKFSLQDPPEKWAEAVLSIPIQREDYTESIVKAGYDVHQVAQWLEGLYLDIVK